MDQHIEVHALQFLPGVPHDLAVGCIDFNEMTVHVGHHHAGGRPRKGIPEARFAGAQCGVFQVALDGDADHVGGSSDQGQIS
jgi:hypothetical protein